MNAHLEAVRQRLIEVGVQDQPLILAVIAFDQLKQFGCFADEYVDLLIEVADPEATIVMNAFTWTFCDTKSFHHENTPGEVGLASEIFRRSEGVSRSHHPIFSLTAIGPLTDDVLAHPGPTCWGDGSPAEYLVDENAFCLSIGKEFPRATTILHSFEEWKRVPYLHFETFSGLADFGSGPIEYETEFYVPNEPPISYRWAPLVRRLLDRGLVRGADFELPIRATFAKDLQRAAYEMLDDDPFVFLDR